MLNGLVANLLNRFLGLYVRNFDPKQLEVGIWSGDVKLRNLELRREALDQFHLPINVVHGHISTLVLKIPWTNLRGQPVRITIEDVFLLASPKEDEAYDAEEEEKRAHAVKMEKLDSAELLKQRNTEGMSQEEQQKQQSFTAALTTTIIDNVQIQVKNVHIRYEDAISDPGHPFAVGVTLQELSAVSTDEEWKPTWIQGSSNTTHKLATLGSLAVYWDTDSSLLGTGTDQKDADKDIDTDHILQSLRELIVKGDSPAVNEHQFILRPVSGRAGLEMDKSGNHDRPKMKARLLFNELGFILDDHQYRDALMLVDLFHYFIRHQEYRKLQPSTSPKQDPRAWLQFAGKSVLDRIHDKNKRWSWAYFAERRDDRKQYIMLFKKKKREEKLTAEETSELDRLEHKLTYEDLRFWRSLARNELRKEGAMKKPEPPKSTWMSYIWGSSTQKQDTAADDSQMTEEQRKELYQAIDFDEKKTLAEAVDMPREAIKLQVDMNLKTGSFTLKRDPHGKQQDMLRLLFDDFSTEFIQRTDSTLVDLSLGGMRLYDGSTDGNLYEQMLTVKDAPPVPASDRVQELGSDGEALKEEKPEDGENDEESDPFFSMSFEQNPLDERADSALTVKLKAMEIVYNPNFVVQVTKFFKPPEKHMESIGALMETAGSTVEGLRQQTRAGLEYALQEHRTIDVQLDLQAPLIIVPDTVTTKSTICLILDAGHASVRSDLIDKATIAEMQGKQKQQYSETDFQKLESLMYDKFLLKLHSTQVLIGTTVDKTKKQLEARDSSHSYHLVDRINMDFTLETCIVPKTADLTKFRIVGHLPVLHAMFSDEKYKALMKLLDFAIPKFVDEKEVRSKRESRVVSDSNAKARRKSEVPPLNKSFQARKEELVLEDDHTSAQKSQTQKRSDDQKSKKKAEVNPSQRNFEFQFTVDKLQGSLYKSDSEGKKPDQLLVDLIAEVFHLEFYQRHFDMVAEVNLKALVVEDHVEESSVPEFQNLISSEDLVTRKQQDLLKVNFQMVNRDHPEFQSKFEGIRTNLDVDISTINLMVTRKTLLTLLDFVMVTFASGDSNAQQDPATTQEIENTEVETAQTPSDGGDKIRIKTQLSRIAVILNNDGIRLATLSLTSAEVKILLSGKTMRVETRLGALDLVDDVNMGVSEDSALRQLVSIQGDELADFRYETFDPASPSYPGHDNSIFLRSGSIKINFVTEPFRKIMEFGVKFGKMQAIFNAAREAAANQASKVQESASKIHFDILIRTPIVAFPRMVQTDHSGGDSMIAYLGEIYANNKFVAIEDSHDNDMANKLSVGIHNIRLTSTFHYSGDKSEELEMIDGVNLDFNITQIEHKAGRAQPDMEIQGSMSNINLRITEAQLKFVMELSQNIPEAFALESEEVETQVEEDMPQSLIKPAKDVQPADTGKQVTSGEKNKPSHLAPELGTDEDAWTKLDFIFKVGAVGLELVKGRLDEPVGDLEAASLSKFSLNEASVKVRMISDGALESELLIQSFTITDSRAKEKNKFRKIMSLINTDVKQQFMASVSISGGEDKNLIALLTIDSPRIILALDYLFDVINFVNAGLSLNAAPVVEEEDDDNGDDLASGDDDASESMVSTKLSERKPGPAKSAAAKQESTGSMSVSYRVNIVDAQVILIANPAISNSEAIVLGTKQVLVSQQQSMTLQVDRVGMFLCRMDKFDTTQLRILDDFSIQTSLDMRSQGKDSSMTSIHVDIEPLVLRLSLRDILLATQIVNKASAMFAAEDQTSDDKPDKVAQAKAASSKTLKAKSTKQTTASGAPKRDARTISTKATKKKDEQSVVPAGSTVLKREEMTVQMDGMRVVLIGDLHELPILDWSVKKFTIDVRDWTGNMTADTSFETFFNVYNFSKSAWEPLIEPWQLGFHMAKETNPDKLVVELYSRKSLELTVTSATIALASKSAQFLSSEEDVFSKPRGNDAPYRIRNYTGFDVNVWANSDSDDEGLAAKLADGEETPWRFEDPSTTRETLSPEGQSGVIGVKLEGSGFDSVERIQVSREGESLYNLKPRKDKTQHRMLVDVKLGTDNVKYIILRSPMLVENHTQIPVELGVYSPEDGHLLKIEKIAPGESRPAPVGAAFMHSLVIRPDQGFGYTWSNEQLFWRDLLKRPIRTLTCLGEQDRNSPPFYFQMQAVFDKNNPLTS